MQVHPNDCPRPEECGCSTREYRFRLEEPKYVGLSAHYSEVYLHKCRLCDKSILELFSEHEAFSKSGRWYAGFVGREVAEQLDPAGAIEILESLPWYFVGGSYYEGRVHTSRGTVRLAPF